MPEGVLPGSGYSRLQEESHDLPRLSRRMAHGRNGHQPQVHAVPQRTVSGRAGQRHVRRLPRGVVPGRHRPNAQRMFGLPIGQNIQGTGGSRMHGMRGRQIRGRVFRLPVRPVPGGQRCVCRRVFGVSGRTVPGRRRPGPVSTVRPGEISGPRGTSVLRRLRGEYLYEVDKI